MKHTTVGRLALCGVMSALALIILLLTAIPVTEISLAALAGIVGIPVTVEAGKKSGILHYMAVGVLAFLLVPSPEGKMLYIFFFGYYTVLKAAIESRRWPRAAVWAVKIAVFNAAMIAAYYVLMTVFHLDADMFTVGGVSLPWVFLAAGNGVFVLYDWCLTRIVVLYLAKWQVRVQRLFRF